MMGIRGRTDRVLDIGSGPESLLFEFGGENCVALDPLTFSDADEARYKAAGISRLRAKGETLCSTCKRREGQFSEAWIYNVLQHTEDPEKIVENALYLSQRLRLWEWVDVPADHLHLNVLREEDLRQWATSKGWRVTNEIRGVWTQGNYPPDNFYSIVVERNA